MEIIKNLIEIIVHIDKHLSLMIQNFGSWSYLVLFAVIFAETGLVITPFLPGDSLLFAAGTLSAVESFNLLWIFIVLSAAAIIGDTVNYTFGKFFGQKIILNSSNRFFKKEYVDRTHKFYEKHGGKTIILARFIPIIRTFAPFVAGVGKMSYYKFFIYNVIGGLLWVSLFVFGGYFFGNMPIVKNNFFVVILVIIVFSVLPIAIEFYKHKIKEGK